MIYISEIHVEGMSDAGPFAGTLRLSEGLQVVSARNSYGKSLAARVVAWCLGLEPMFGAAINDPHWLQLAVTEEIELSGSRTGPSTTVS